jgi:hypothetical protein
LIIQLDVTSTLQGRREGGGGQNTRGPECSEGPGNLGKMFVLSVYHRFMFVRNEIRLLIHYPLIVVIDRKT